jgi:RNA polymerase sigma factor (sigma-70 family)
VVLAGGEADLTDGQLLEDFISRRDEAAVAALVRRHGPMVMGACRRILRDSHDAEDALQATFLVLARKGHSILRRERIAPWLYDVAVRTAMALRGRKARGRLVESEVFHMRDAETKAEERTPDRQIQFDQEMQGLPEKYRTVLVLCELLGLSRRDAAKQLRLSEGTVSSRLARGRQMFRNRLERHGFTGLQMAGAPVAASLIAATAKAARLATEGGALAECVSTSVASLVEGVMKNMLVSKTAIKTVVVLALGGLLAGAASWSGGPTGFPQQPLPPANAPVPLAAGAQAAAAKSECEPARCSTDLQVLDNVPQRCARRFHRPTRPIACSMHSCVGPMDIRDSAPAG